MKRNRRYSRPRTCNGKVCYDSHRIAEEVIEARRLDNPTLYLRSYRCPDCGLFHLTHKPDRFEGVA